MFIFPNKKIHLVKEKSSVLCQSGKHKENAGQHPGFNSSQTLRLGCVGGDVVEDVDQHQEQGDQQGHPARYHVHRDEKGYPGYNHKQTLN